MFYILIIGHATSVLLLLEHKALPNMTNHRKNTPLHIACSHLHYPVIKILLQHGARKDILNQGKKFCYQTPQKQRDRDTIWRHINRLVFLLDQNEDIHIAFSFTTPHSKQSLCLFCCLFKCYISSLYNLCPY